MASFDKVTERGMPDEASPVKPRYRDSAAPRASDATTRGMVAGGASPRVPDDKSAKRSVVLAQHLKGHGAPPHSKGARPR